MGFGISIDPGLEPNTLRYALWPHSHSKLANACMSAVRRWAAFITPERRRWIIVALIFFAIVLNYIDRQIVSILKPTLKKEFGLDDQGYAVLTNIFTVCYAAMYPVAGWLVDRFGPRLIMLVGIITWSSASFLAGLTRHFTSFASCRALLGLAEPLASGD